MNENAETKRKLAKLKQDLENAQYRAGKYVDGEQYDAAEECDAEADSILAEITALELDNE
jgi:hypothetical protein